MYSRFLSRVFNLLNLLQFVDIFIPTIASAVDKRNFGDIALSLNVF